MEIYTGFIIGLLGSFHCIGMCGPIALALPVSSSFKYKFYSVRRKLSKLVPVFAVILALIFILRGMNLGIKYISPSLKPPASSQSTNDSLICH